MGLGEVAPPLSAQAANEMPIKPQILREPLMHKEFQILREQWIEIP
jgi:hypothetical protein